MIQTDQKSKDKDSPHRDIRRKRPERNSSIKECSENHEKRTKNTWTSYLRQTKINFEQEWWVNPHGKS